MHIHSFAPIADEASELLILGSMPGKASLLAGEYYAHPRNGFWRIMAALFEIDAAAPYERRVAALRKRRIALWDVLASCTRATSLDSDIDDSSIAVNDFARFLGSHAKIRSICFNGAKAEQLYRGHVLPMLTSAGELRYHRLPSTSPAHAAMSHAAKVEAWRAGYAKSRFSSP